MNKFNVYITAIVGATLVFMSAIWGTVFVISSRDHGLFDYLMALHSVTPTSR